MVKEVGHDWVSLCWKKPELKGKASPIITYKVEAWLCGEGAFWVEVRRILQNLNIVLIAPKTNMLD